MKTSIDSTGVDCVLADTSMVNCASTDTSIIMNVKDDTLLIDSIDVSSCEASMSDTKENTIWLKDGQPSGWTQLLLPVFITLIVVFLEKRVDKYFNNKKEKRERERYRKTVIDWIKLITPIEINLSKSLSDLSNTVEQSDDMNPERYAMPSTIPDKLGSLTVEQMMDSFLTDFKGDKKKCSSHIYNIISCLDFLSKTRNEITKAYEAYNKQSFSCCEQWNTEISVFKKWVEQQNDAAINDIVKLWAARLIVKNDSIQAHEKLVNDVLQLYGTNVDITPSLIKMNNIILQRKALSNGYATVFSNLSKYIIVSLEQLSAACTFFEEKNLFR